MVALAQKPDMPTRGLAQNDPGDPDPAAAGASTRYLAAQDGPCLVALAVRDPAKGSAALVRCLGVFATYGYAEYRFSCCWLLLGAAAYFPDAQGRPGVREGVVSSLQAAVGGGGIEYEGSLAVAVEAVAAQAGDAAARALLLDATIRLLADAASLRSGRAPSGSDRWGHHMRGLRVHAHAHAQALGWAWGDTSLAEPLLDAAASLADSGLAGFQAPACLALAETLRPCREGDPPPPYPRIDGTLDQARQAVHNVQDPTVCARTTARVHVMGRHGWPTFDLDARARRLPEARHGLAYNALHRVGIGGEGRRPGGLPSPAPQCDGRSLPALQALYQQPWDDFVRLNAPDRPRQPCDEVACPTRACCR